MTDSHSDALVFFGAIGDLAYKKIFPAAASHLGVGSPNYLRFWISPEMTIAFGTTVMDSSAALRGQMVEMVASRHPCPGEMDAYERVLGDAMAGGAMLFAREDYVEESWRIVDPIVNRNSPVVDYQKGTWGPAEAESKMAPPGGWHNPMTTDEQDFRLAKAS